jgi:hypothetical protein
MLKKRRYLDEMIEGGRMDRSARKTNNRLLANRMYMDPRVIKSVIKNSARGERSILSPFSRVVRNKNEVVTNSCMDFVKEPK